MWEDSCHDSGSRARGWRPTPRRTLAIILADLVATKGVVLNGGYNDRYPLGSGHWNEVGNRAAAEMTGEQLCAGSRAIARMRQ